MLDSDIREEFNRLKCTGQRELKSSSEKHSKDKAVIDYLNNLLNSNTVEDFEDISFCFWNISDSYAMLRDSEQEYKNHLKFSDHISRGENKYGFWTVCDATQRFTLILGGYGEFWQELYKNAVENIPITDENYRAAYEAHRAAVSVHPALKIPNEFVLYSDKMFGKFLDSCKDREEYRFYRLIYLSSQIKAFGKTNTDIKALCSEFYQYLSCDDIACEFVAGEWGFLNRFRSERNRAVVGITAAVNALIDVGEIHCAKEIYLMAQNYGLPANAYINKRLLI